MVFTLIRNWRRKRIARKPFPPTWEPHLRGLPFFHTLNAEQQQRLRTQVQVFIAEKDWEGCGGLKLDNAIRVGIAAQACLLILELDLDYYARVRTILVYPGAFHNNMEGAGPDGSVGKDHGALAGEAWLSGQVILAWDLAFHGGRDPGDGRNPVFHEFAHKLDMLDGWADGEPPLHQRDQIQHWRGILQQEFDDLCARRAAGKSTELTDYATTNRAEFFAVSTEFFFERPAQLQQVRPELFQCLKDFYRQDPLARLASDAR